MATPKEWAQVIAKAWLDEEFKRLLESDPSAAFEQCGIETDVVFPVPPRPDELSDEQLEAIVGNEKAEPFYVIMNCTWPPDVPQSL